MSADLIGTPSKHPTNNQTEALARGIRRLWGIVVQGLRQGDAIGGLHLQQFWVLVMTREEPIRMSEIAEALQTSQANVTGLVDRLEQAGHVERVRSESDRRVINVAITKEGSELIRDLRRTYLDHVDAALARLSSEDRSQLLALLDKALGEA